MAWAKVDDGWWSHPKVMGLSLSARGLWVSALSWSCHQRMDHVPDRFLPMVGATEEDASELVNAGLWHESSDGYRIHDWAEYQDMSLAEKRAEAGRKGGQASGESRRLKQTVEATPKQTKQTNEANGEAGTHPFPSRPDPSPPENPVVESAPPPSTSLALVAEVVEPSKPDPVVVVFDAWRESTGHHRAKLTTERRTRIRKWLKAGYSPEDLADACRGITLSDFHRGRNDRNTVYDDLSVALKDSRNIERFMALAREGIPLAAGPKAKGMAGIEAFVRKHAQEGP